MQTNATGDIAIGILRRNGTIATPVYLWTDLGAGPAWVDFAAMTALQFSAWVDRRSAPAASADGGSQPRDLDLTISRTQF